ncbi:MAG TPA: CAP domain-containing protein [Anaerolineales bacterium]|nr:CAP domain-containing protein [Anaerolineales bacterium]
MYNHFAVTKIRPILIILQLVFLPVLPIPVQADSVHPPAYAITAYDLINAVNALRAAYGLPVYGINSILMFTAQNQAEFMASTGHVTHSGPGGITLTQRLLAAGYPLAGDLAAGGFRAENITSGSEGMAAESAVDGWMGDALHQNTMLSVNLTEIGAGVAVANGRAYLVIDAARPVDAPNVPFVGTSVAAGEAPIAPVILSTPNAEGEVIHEVRYGQTLWRLAISYDVKIDDIKRLNGLFDNIIYPGNRLLIKLEATSTPLPATATVSPMATLSPTATLTPSWLPLVRATMTSAALIEPETGNVMNWAIGIIVLALLGGGAFALLGSRSGAGKNAGKNG